MAEISEIQSLREDLRGYHGDVKRRLDVAEDEIKALRMAVNGVAGDDTVPGLNVEVQNLRAAFDGFRDRARIGLSAAWAAILASASILWSKR